MHTTTVHGVSIPTLGYGTFQLSGLECRRGVEHALAVGYRHIDTAQMYGNESAVGEALAAGDIPREEVFLTTKIANDMHAHDDVLRSTEQSLERLGSGYVDLLLIHWPPAADVLSGTLAAMRSLQEAGAVRMLGVSNFPPSLLRRAVDEAPVRCNQVECHPYLQQRALRALCAELGVHLTAYSPLARGEVARDPVLRELGERRAATPAQVALRWLIDLEGVSAIPKARSPERIEENWGALQVALTDEDRSRIEELDSGRRGTDPPFAPDWED